MFLKDIPEIKKNEIGELRLHIVASFVIIISVIQLLMLQIIFANTNIIASLLVLRRKKLGLILYQFSVSISVIILLFNLIFYLYSGIKNAAGADTTLYFLFQFLILTPAVYIIARDKCTASYFGKKD